MSLIPSAFAATSASTTSSTQSTVMSFLPMIVIFVLFWFLLIRPQQKKTKAHNQMITQLQKGDEVITSSGIAGKIAKIEDQFVFLEAAPGVVIPMQKNSVTSKLEKGTLNKVQ